jgi:branched-chain amino acid transport system substrate-binding protein
MQSIITRFLILLLAFIILHSCAKPQAKKNQLISTDILSEYVILDINTANLNSEYIQHYYNGMNMAIEEINSKGGVNGLPLVLKRGNDFGNHLEAYNVAKKLVSQYKPVVITGTTQSTTAEGVARYSKDYKIPFIATGTPTETIIYGGHASKYTFRLRDGYNTHVEAIASAIIADTDINSFTVITYSNNEAKILSAQLKERILQGRKVNFTPDIQVPKNRVVGLDVSDKLYNSISRGVIIMVDHADISSLISFLQSTKLLNSRKVYIMLAGEPEWLDSLGNLTPNGWITTGYPWYSIKTNANINFANNYQKKYQIKPRYSSYLGYSVVQMISANLMEGKIYDNTEESRNQFVRSLHKIAVDTPIGVIEFKNSNISNIGTYVGMLQPYDKEGNVGRKISVILDVRMFNSHYFEVKDI